MPHPLLHAGRLYLTDGGLETDLMFNKGVELPGFSAIMLLRSAEGRAALDGYFRSYLDLARRTRTGFILESASWRASADWAETLDVTPAELDRLSGQSVAMLKALAADHATPATPVLVSGCIGPRGDGYDPGRIMSRIEAKAYHLRQAAALAAAGPDLLTAMTITNVNEAIGIAQAAEDVGLPAVISFTVETDGRLPTGDPLGAAIEAVDRATSGYPAWFMVNCAHPTHFEAVLAKGGSWTRRIGGIRANASKCSHAELDVMAELDPGDPAELGEDYRRLRALLPHLAVLGGCCGTDQRHIEAIAAACLGDEVPRAA
jgi:S-methylmethionine-dependent homocysteine/selenocysteine methylase